MCTNFEFLKFKNEFNDFSNACIEAEKSIMVSPATTAILSRRALELAVKWVYAHDGDLIVPYQDKISSLIHNNSFVELIDSGMLDILKFVIKLGNKAVHTNKVVTREEAVLSLNNLFQFINWIDYCYSDNYTEKHFDETLLPEGKEEKVKPEELKELYEQLSSKDKKLEEIVKENENLRKEISAKRKENTEDYDFKIDEISEYNTRKLYIDLELELAGWDFKKNIGQEVELFGMPNSSEKGYADYVLYGDNGKPLAVVEAKRTSVNPSNGQHQAKLYADCLENQYGVRPVIFLTNGFEMFLLDDYNNYPKRQVYGFYKKDELQLLIDRRTTKKSLRNIDIKDEISNRYYQKEAIIKCCEDLEQRKRKLLLVMATGTGKTRTAISLVDVLERHNWVKNVLFLADRKALVRQAKKNFSKLLPNLSLCNLLDSKDNPEQSRMVFSTYPTMMNAIDETKGRDDERLFTCGHFDLIIIDESHRSIYRKYKAIFDYFDSILVGLTATPKDEVDKNTYSIFDMENGVPTYAYEFEKAVEDKFLVDYETLEVTTKIMEDGIKYDELSDEEKEEFEDTFDDDETITDEISNTAINEWLFNDNTIDIVLNNLMEKGLRIEGNEKLGKTIIFAKNHNHAEVIKKRFDILFPELGDKYAQIIDNRIRYSESLIDDFSDKDKEPQIAISVDMLDTGIDVPEILNLVFFKKVRSKTKFWQMIGRGTRLCEDLLGAGADKEKFLIFDFCNNFDFFRMNPKGFEGNLGQTLSERIFNLKVDIMKELQDLRYSEQEYTDYRNDLLNQALESINNLNENKFTVKMNLRYVHMYKNKEEWAALGTVNTKDIKMYISPLIESQHENEYAKRFDILMYTIELANLQGFNASRPIKTVIKTAEKLSKLGSIPEIQAQKTVIDEVRTTEFWEDADIFALDDVRDSLRGLIKYLEKTTHILYETRFEDTVIREESHGAMYNSNNLQNYKKKVEYYLKEHENELVIHKLKNNMQLTKQDLETLESIMWTELGTKADYEKEFGDMPVNKLVRKMVGLDRQAANELFSEFLNNESLNTKQIHFVKLIVDYVVKNGLIDDNRVLLEDPFRTVGSITVLFGDNMDYARSIMGKVAEIKRNAEEII